MPATKDVESLLQGIVDGNWCRIVEVADRISNKLRKQKHIEDADYIKQLVDRRDVPEYLQNANNNTWYRITEPETKLSDLIVPDSVTGKLKQVFKEYSKRQLLKEHGLSNANKILLIGNPGTGKTMTAEIIAHEVGLPLKTIRQENIIDSKIGQTATNLATILPSYKEASVFPGVYFLDEFDTLASKRVTANQAADREYNEITNTLLKEMDHINSDCFLVCASNLSADFDPAVFRRFDMIIKYPDSNPETVRLMLKRQLEDIAPDYNPEDKLCQELVSFPPSVIKLIALDAKKAKILDDTPITDDLIRKLSQNKER